jgi:hypothetical protein
MGREPLDLVVKHENWPATEFTAESDPTDPRELRQLVFDAIKRYDGRTDYIEEYAMEVRYAGEYDLVTTFVASH